MRELAARHAEQPFAILGVNTDELDRSVLAKKMKDAEISWPSIVDGPQRRARNAQRWNVRSYPTLVVVDSQGVIRWRGHRHEEAAKEVERLLSRGR